MIKINITNHYKQNLLHIYMPVQIIRPTFYFKNNPSLPIRAAGILPYKREGDNIKFLMIKHNNVYEDFGGKTDIVDGCVEETAIREALEESNNIFTQDLFVKQLYYSQCNRKKMAYYKKAKYVVYLLEIHDEYDCNIFGTSELHDRIVRTVEWVDLERFLDVSFLDKLHLRLRFSYFFHCLMKL